MERGRADLDIYDIYLCIVVFFNRPICITCLFSLEDLPVLLWKWLNNSQTFYWGLFAADKSQPNSHILWEWHVRWQCEDLSQLLLLCLLARSAAIKWKYFYQVFLVFACVICDRDVENDGDTAPAISWVTGTTSNYWGGWPSTLNPSQRILLPLTIYTVTHFRTTFPPLLDWSFCSGPGFSHLLVWLSRPNLTWPTDCDDKVSGVPALGKPG